MGLNSARIWALVPAAGVGRRMAADRPKQYLKLGERTVLEHTLDRLLGSRIYSGIVVAVSEDDGYWDSLSLSRSHSVSRVTGGSERADSVLAGLNFIASIAAEDEWVMVHDAARPCLTANDIRRLRDSVANDKVGGILALPVHDTLKSTAAGRIEYTVDRTRIWRALTPQMFRLGLLRDALIAVAQAGRLVTDEAGAVELQGLKPLIVEGRPDNIKITRPEDLPLAAYYLERQRCE
ncbi:MAG: 2-C-methyl-D-erythritol 4-phosphate cytidylyltransferase [Methylococcaceae bacterium]|nr:2-C-methyl-D-erythritol 4-phosphate cytidylyltransferase [Methylococcaceae bacterium]MCI0732996.1 2-C-methyl-D-erythritol 4-phosphate cytidylyltransferase [Methylococcaceae bacterium]